MTLFLPVDSALEAYYNSSIASYASAAASLAAAFNVTIPVGGVSGLLSGLVFNSTFAWAPNTSSAAAGIFDAHLVPGRKVLVFKKAKSQAIYYSAAGSYIAARVQPEANADSIHRRH